MKKKKSSDEARKSFQEMFNALVPPIEELDGSEIADMLVSSGLDPDALAKKAHEHLQKLAGSRYLSRGKSVPTELKNALHQLRPPTMAEQLAIETDMARSAIRTIFGRVSAEIAEGVKGLGTRAAMQPAFRNKKELTDVDRRKLAELQEELDNGQEPE
jgi:hypothetical protein